MIASEVRILRSLAQLNHSHIVRYHGVHACGKYLILVMERADCNLHDLHQAYRENAGSGGNVPPEHALDLLEQAAVALDFLATLQLRDFNCVRGLQHCDVKPSNLLMFGDTLKVADFGLCAGTGWHTHTGGWKGTLPYAAPELFNGAAAPGTDQFALAVTFCELVVGNRAFYPGSTPTGLPVDLTQLRAHEFPIISRALHPYPSSRWPTCQVFIQALRKVALGPRPSKSTRIFPRGLQGTLRVGSNSAGGGNGTTPATTVKKPKSGAIPRGHVHP
jgi:serine/threonine protein kinase